jgi:hypothetical protein
MNEWRADLDGEAADLLYQLKHNPSPALQQQYDTLQKRIRTWIADHRAVHVNWVYEQELKGFAIHRSAMTYGPKHPCSYLLYLDGKTLVFQRNHQNNYSSYSFWLEHLLMEEPINHLGSTWFSAKELDVDPSIIERLYILQTIYLTTGELREGEEEEMVKIHAELQLKLTKRSAK